MTTTFRTWTLALATLAIGALALTPAAAQTAPEPGGKTRFVVLRPQVGVFAPKEADARAAFGDVWADAALTINLVERQLCPKHTLALRVDSMLRQKGDDELLIVPMGVEYTAYTKTTGNVRPYWLVSANAVHVKLKVADRGLDADEMNFGMTLGLGAKIGKRGFVQVTHFTTDQIEQFDICGTRIAAGATF